MEPSNYPPTKRCSRCGKVLKRSEFYKNKGRPDGIQTVCKTCTRAINMERQQADPEWWRKYRKDRPPPTPEQQAAAKARYQKWVEANPGRAAENSRRWYAENLDLARAIARRRASTRKARQLAVFVEPVDPLIVLERDDGVCGICGGDVDPFNFHVDHVIPLARGGEHSYANVQAAHPSCNARKWARLPDEIAVAA